MSAMPSEPFFPSVGRFQSLDKQQVPNVQAAITNARAFASEVVAKLRQELRTRRSGKGRIMSGKRAEDVDAEEELDVSDFVPKRAVEPAVRKDNKDKVKAVAEQLASSSGTTTRR